MNENKAIENREYKSDVFSMLMQVPEYALDVYNALNGSDYKDPNLVEMKTLEKCISLTVRNDAAFIIDMHLSIYEHQGTYNPNMPLRILIYLADILKPIIKQRDIYSRKKITIPTPNFVVFYNGIEDRPRKEIQRLSDSYVHGEEINLELICTVYNINPGYNEDIRKKSEVLDGYTIFVEKVREYLASEDEEAISHAVDYCIEHGVLEDFFAQNKSEVVKNMTIDMTFERRMELSAKENFEDGLAQGISQGLSQGIDRGIDISLIDMIIKKVKKNKSIDQIANELEESVDDIRPKYDAVIANPGKTAEEIYRIMQNTES